MFPCPTQCRGGTDGVTLIGIAVSENRPGGARQAGSPPRPPPKRALHDRPRTTVRSNTARSNVPTQTPRNYSAHSAKPTAASFNPVSMRRQ
jgi:hypothetical protein